MESNDDMPVFPGHCLCFCLDDRRETWNPKTCIARCERKEARCAKTPLRFVPPRLLHRQL